MTQPSGESQALLRITGGRRLTPAPFLVAGIVNITPDSFSDGGSYFSPESATQRVRQIVAEGVDIVDLGAESTRPGAADIGHAEEWRRLEKVLAETLAYRDSSAQEALCRGKGESETGRNFVVSIDTFRAETAAKALAAGENGLGVDIINDVSGGAFDPAMDDVLAEFKPGYILGHSPARPDVMQQQPRYGNVVDELLQWFSMRMTALIKAGLPEECICLDPCIGFGKTLEHHLAIFAAVPRLLHLGRPLCFGISRKSFFGALLGETVGVQQRGASSKLIDGTLRERDIATQTAVALLGKAGVAVHRVHQVADTVTTLAVVQKMGF